MFTYGLQGVEQIMWLPDLGCNVRVLGKPLWLPVLGCDKVRRAKFTLSRV